jgi:hypothetical protein
MAKLSEKLYRTINQEKKTFLSLMIFILLIFAVGATGYRDYQGEADEKTPYDIKYKRVYQYLKKAETDGIKKGVKKDEPVKRSFVNTDMRKCGGDFCTFKDARKKVEEYLRKAHEFQYDEELFYEELPNPAFHIKGAMADYWQLPDETEKRGKGDCEDKAIWLYSKLLKEGFHAWVVWYYDDAVFILDPTKQKTIRELKDFASDYYQPYYSYYKERKWCHTVC